MPFFFVPQHLVIMPSCMDIHYSGGVSMHMEHSRQELLECSIRVHIQNDGAECVT